MLLPLLVSFAAAGEPISLAFGPRGLTASDASGDNSVAFGLSFQPRVTATVDPDPAAADTDRVADAGLRMRRMLFTAGGKLGGRIEYRFRVNVAGSLSFTDGADKAQVAGRAVLDDAQVIYKIAEPLQIAVGQWKVPFTATQMISDTALLFPDRALAVDGFRFGGTRVDGFSWSRDAGVAVQGNDAKKFVEYSVGAFNGDGQNVFPGDDGPLLVARVQVAPLGEMKLDEVDLAGGPPRLALAVGATHNIHPTFDDEGVEGDAERITRFGGELRFTAAGFSAQAEGLGGLAHASGADTDVASLGAYAQAGWVGAAGVGPGVRWSIVDPDLDTADDAYTQLEGVVTWFLPDPGSPGHPLGHKAKLMVSWATTLKEGDDEPVAHQAQLAAVVGL